MIVSINDIKAEMKLSNDVFSKLGGVLYRKGTILNLNDIEIFAAFGVKQIEVIDDNEIDLDKYIKKEKIDVFSINEFQKLYKSALKTLDNIYTIAQSNALIPIMDLRKALQPLLKEEYIKPRYLLSLKFISGDYGRNDSSHALAVGILSYAIAVWLDLEQGERMQIAMSGSLHDIGMNRISSQILLNKGNLDKDEFSEIKKHSLYGYQILKETKGLNEGSLLGVLQHHEREDGKGYPLNLKGNQIHLYAKIIAIADVFNAMTSKRTYREEYYPYQALEQLTSSENHGIDRKIINLFITKMTYLESGTKVLLNNDQEGYIVSINPEYPTRPIIEINKSLLNLLNEKQIYIKKVY